MTTFFISRHPGAINWIKQHGIAIDRWETHLSTEDVLPGDTVVGTLPVPMVAELNEKGARYIHLSIEIPASLRGKELSADDLNMLGASLRAYLVKQE